ncbi:MAG: hypothetical protein JHC33_03675 [Ignisphaera sp.]|nr:hypothetical protein [Ignisphaera sp.]
MSLSVVVLQIGQVAIKFFLLVCVIKLYKQYIEPERPATRIKELKMFKPGDVLLYTAPALKFSNIIPRLIRLATGNKVTHVAVYLGTNEYGHVILDALSNGVKLKVMSESEIFDRKDDFKLYAISRLPECEAFSKSSVFMFSAAKYANTHYGYLTILNILLQHGKGRLFNKPWSVWFKSKKGYICSEVCQLVIEDVLRLNKIRVPFTKIAAITEPDDYLSAPWKVIEL